MRIGEQDGKTNTRILFCSQLLKAADLNEMLHQRRVEKKVTVQKVCTRARNESEVRESLDRIWNDPATSAELLDQLAFKNASLFEFEKALQTEENLVPQVAMTIQTSSLFKSQTPDC